MKRSLVLTLAVTLSFIMTVAVYAGEGSDTVGDGKLLPQLRYSYMQSELDTDMLLLNSGSYNLTQHDVYMQLNWGVNSNVDIYGLVGARIESLDADMVDMPFLLPIHINGKYDNAVNFLYGLGVKATFYRADNGFYVGGGLLFTHSFGEDKDLKLSGDVLGMDLGTLIDSSGIPTKIDTKMITLTPDIHAGWRFKNGLTPYLGLEYRWVWAEASYDLGQVLPIDGAVTINFKQKDALGIFAGLDYHVNDRLYFNVEGNILDRWGVSAGLGYLFDINERPASANTPSFLGGGGIGSDTVGDCRLLPQVRYSYMQSELETDFVLLNGGKYNLTQNDVYMQLNWGVNSNVDIYGLVGARIESLDADMLDMPFFLPIHINGKYDNAVNFLYGLGVKATFYRADNGFYVGGGLLFTHSFGEDKDLKLSGDVLGIDLGTLIDSSGIPTKIDTKMTTLTPDIHVGWHFKNGLSPYFGLEYRWVWAEASYDLGQVLPIDGAVAINFKQKDALGIFAGLDYHVNDRLYFNVEGNILDRWGVSAGFGYLFDICEKPKPVAPVIAPVIEPKLEPMSKN